MTAGSTLLEVRTQLFDLLEAEIPEDCSFGWDLPIEPADVDGPTGMRRSVWLKAEVDANATHDVLTAGWMEQWTQVVRIQCLPEDGSVDTPSADAAAAELLDVVVGVIEANHRPAVEGWSVQMTYGGFRYRSGRLDGSDGYAASYEIDVDVEASRCS